MNIKVYSNRETIPIDDDVFGTQNENNVTTLKIEVPEKYQKWNKRIVFITDKGNKWDILRKDDTYVLQNNITKYEKVEAYIWLTEKADATEESINDFRSKTFKLSFFANEDANDLIATDEQVDGFNSMLTALNVEIEAVKQINTDFTKLKKDIEQAETERNNKVKKAVNTIKDLKEDYDENAKKKTNEFNSNVTKQTEDFNKNTTEKEKAYNDLAEEKEAELNTIADGVKNMATAIQLPQFYVDDEMDIHGVTATKLSNIDLYYDDETGDFKEGVI